MALIEARFCLKCGTALVDQEAGGRPRRVCPAKDCGFVFWGNPTPVVAAIVEYEGRVILVRANGWPEKMFGLVTGFLEANETPEEGVLREVKEELSLDGEVASLVGVYDFDLRNELIIAYHVRARGELRLGDELEAFKAIDPDKLRPWPYATGKAVEAWLARRVAGRPEMR